MVMNSNDAQHIVGSAKPLTPVELHNEKIKWRNGGTSQ